MLYVCCNMKKIFIQDQIECEQLDRFINLKLNGYNSDCVRFFKHIVNCLLNSGKQWIPISSRVKKKYFRHNHKIKEKGLSEFLSSEEFVIINKHRNRYRELKKCWEYKINQKLWSDIEKIFRSFEPIDLVRKQRFLKHLKYKESNQHRLPKIILNSLENLKQCHINYCALEQLHQRAIDQHNKKLELEIISFKLYLNRQKFDPKSNTYFLAYKCSSTGRICERGSGIQSKSKIIKHHAFSLPNIHNYDLKSSHIAALVNECEKYGIECPAFKTFLSNPEAKKMFANELSISPETFKKILYIKLYSGNCGNMIFNKHSKFYDVLKDEVQSHDEYKDRFVSDRLLHYACEDWTKFFNMKMEPFNDDLKKWNKLLRLKFENRKRIKNTCDLYLDVSKLSKRKFIPSISAFILQGVESRFIHELTALSKYFDFKVISNEHDGVVTIGKIDETVIDLAKQRSEFYNAELVEKPFI